MKISVTKILLTISPDMSQTDPILDSGLTQHMTPHKDDLDDFKNITKSVIIADNSSI